jgi:outer membrane immunogenic protein
MKLRSVCLAGIALGASCAVQAQAADFSTPYVVANNWAGPYVGGTLGFTDARATVSVSGPLPISVTGTGSQVGLGFLAGYNWQHGNTVYGIEADADLSSGFDYFGTLRGRYGVLYGNWLVYGTAGLSFASSGTYNGLGWSYGYDNVGYVVGGGAEAKINNHIGWGIEGLYYGLMEDSQTIFGTTVKTSVDAFTVRARLTYRFDGY